LRTSIVCLRGSAAAPGLQPKQEIKRMASRKKAKKATKKKSTKKRAKKAVKKSVKKAAKKAARKPARKAAKKSAKKKVPVRKAATTPVKAKKKAPKKKKQIVGEGDYAATRAFDQEQATFVKRNKAKIPAMGKAAEAALEGPEGEALRDAEATAAARSRDTF
jgi:hypothetical protein